MVSTVVTVAPGVLLAMCRTHTLWPGLMVLGAVVKLPLQPIEYSPRLLIWQQPRCTRSG